MEATGDRAGVAVSCAAVKQLWKGYRSVDGHVALALVYTAAILTTLDRFFLPRTVEAWLRDQPRSLVVPSLDAGLIWAGASTAGYMVIPLLITLFLHRQSPRSIGFNGKGFWRHLLVYLVLFGFMLPFILMAAERPAFLNTYPFIRAARVDVADFFRWEVAYLIQFFALESFFRGYLLFTLERKMGWTAIFVMAVPYCMIHNHKPPLEQFGSIIAGVALGGLALRFRSWYGGAILHALVAATMDFLSVSHSGLFDGQG